MRKIRSCLGGFREVPDDPIGVLRGLSESDRRARRTPEGDAAWKKRQEEQKGDKPVDVEGLIDSQDSE